MDTVDRQTRSMIMSRVGQKDTGAELMIRGALHKAGLRYRLHDRSLPGSPDIVFPRYRAVIFVHGCYWHFHGCHRSTVPKSRRQFWTDKFVANRARDARNIELLLWGGWRVCVVWECVLKGKTSRPVGDVAETIRTWLNGTETTGNIGCPLLGVQKCEMQ